MMDSKRNSILRRLMSFWKDVERYSKKSLYGYIYPRHYIEVEPIMHSNLKEFIAKKKDLQERYKKLGMRIFFVDRSIRLSPPHKSPINFVKFSYLCPVKKIPSLPHIKTIISDFKTRIEQEGKEAQRLEKYIKERDEMMCKVDSVGLPEERLQLCRHNISLFKSAISEMENDCRSYCKI